MATTGIPRPPGWLSRASLTPLVGALLAAAPLAQGETYQLDPVEVVAGRGITSREFGPRPTVIDRADIELRGTSSVADLLREVPGLDVTKQGGAGGLTFVSMRGGDPNFVLFLVDGVRVNDSTNTRGGGIDLSTLDPAMIQRIEVYRGSLSTARGSDALSGVVNIITRGGERPGTLGVRIAGDSAGGRRVSGLMGGKAPGDGTWTLSAGDSREESDVAGDELSRRYLTARAGSAPGEAIRLGLQSSLSDGVAESFPEDSGGPRLAVLRDTERREFRRYTLSGDAEIVPANGIVGRAAVDWSRLREDVQNPGIAPGVLDGVPALNSEREFDSLTLNLASSYRPVPSLEFGFGGVYLREAGESSDIIQLGEPLETDFSLRRHTVGIFLETWWRPSPAARLEASVRRDHPSTAEPVNVYRVAGEYRLPALGTELRASWGQGFKLPSFFALGSALVGNPDLKPERSTQTELSFSQLALADTLEINLRLFRARYRDLVDFDPELFTNVNRGLVTADGVEAEVRLTPRTELVVAGHVTYQDIDLSEQASPLRRRPEWKGGGSAEWRFRSGSGLRLGATYTGAFADSSVPSGAVTLPGFWRVDFSSRWNLSAHAQIGISVSNLLNERYEETVGFPAQGRELALELSLRL